MRIPLFIALAALVAMPAQAATIQTFSIEDAKSRGIDGCGYAFMLPADYDAARAFVFLNDGDRGIVKMDGHIVEVGSADTDGKGTYESADHKVHIEPKITIGPALGQELWPVDGHLVFTIAGRKQTLKIKGHMGC